MLNPYKDFSHVNPQREDGNRQIENTIFRALTRACLTGAEYQITLCVIDMTWGWGKTQDTIGMVQFENMTGQDHGYIVRTLKSLEAKRLIIVERHGGGRSNPNTYMFNKYWDTWIKPETHQALVLAILGG